MNYEIIANTMYFYMPSIVFNDVVVKESNYQIGHFCLDCRHQYPRAMATSDIGIA